jgi:hypothetical protein
MWACGAAGSALPWHGRGRRFDPDQVHQSQPFPCIADCAAKAHRHGCAPALFGIYNFAVQEGAAMSSQLRITVDELKRRMESGEHFTIIDTRNPGAWAEADTLIPEAIRVPADQLEQNLSRIPKTRPIVAYCT